MHGSTRRVSMPGTVTSVHVTNILGLVGFLILWVVLFECARMLMMVMRNDSLIGWAIGPLGVSTLFLSEPSLVFILFNAFFPAVISGSVLYLGLFTAFPRPIVLPHYPLVETLVIAVGVLLTSAGDLLNALPNLLPPF